MKDEDRKLWTNRINDYIDPEEPTIEEITYKLKKKKGLNKKILWRSSSGKNRICSTRGRKSMLYMWFYATGMYSNPIFLYEYQPSIAKKHPKEKMFINKS